MRISVLVRLFLAVGLILPSVYSQNNVPLRLIQTIPMPNVEGRIDHLALDIEHQRLYVAALGNNTLEVLDLRAAKVSQTITRLKEPQGIVYVPDLGKLFVTTGGDGKCYAFAGDPLRQLSVLEIGEDADNIRYDAGGKRLYVGYGNGALGVVDASALKRLGDIKLAGHPESFQLEKTGPKIYVNVPDAQELTVVDRLKQNVLSRCSLNNLRANFPMALIEADHRILVATRRPARLVVLNSASGKMIEEIECAGDADDLFYDTEKKLVYVSCGEGVIDIFAKRNSDHYQKVVRIPTAPGARTAMWVPELKQLFLAVPTRGGQQAAVRIYRRD
jgi:DNA-binding beta-propeller fold protein YncE